MLILVHSKVDTFFYLQVSLSIITNVCFLPRKILLLREEKIDSLLLVCSCFALVSSSIQE